MSETEILEATNKIDEQGQKWILCCNDKEINSIAEDRIFYIDRCHDDYSFIEGRRPEYLILLEKDTEFIERTSFIYEWGGKHYIVENEAAIISRKIESNIISIDKEVCFLYSQKEIRYPLSFKEKVNKYWEYLVRVGKKHFNGIMFSINEIRESSDELRFIFGKTYYKYMIYSKEHDFRNDYHTCTTASIALLETMDGYSILGKMSANSAFANQYKCLGGALSTEDINGEFIDINSMFSREIKEEIGLDISDKSVCISNKMKWLLIREKMAFVGVCSVIKLKMTKVQVQQHFNIFKEIDTEKEIDELIFVSSFEEINQIQSHQKADYVDELYKCYYSKKDCITWEQYKKEHSL
ncbi:MAG: hypothetical protein MSA91_04325 [Lachnobacterium sp.]|nr:hypothetical protein [Lachnobacterium sp.]